MNIKEVKQEIKNTVSAYLCKGEDGRYVIPSIRQRPLLLIGPPGIGKTQIMEQIARECRIGLVAYTITHHTRQSAVGLPMIRQEEYEGSQYSVTEYTMSEIIASIYERRKKTGVKEGILFIDEINCVSETLAPAMLQFLQCKTFGNQAVPEGWIIVAAGNPPEYNKSVRDFDLVTLDRVRMMDVEADYSVWREYAREKGIHGALLSYLELRPGNFYRIEADVDGAQFVTARGWEDFSELLYVNERLGIPVTSETVYEFLRHQDVAEDVAAYLDLYQKYQDDYGIPDILQGRVKTSVYTRLHQAGLDERISVVNLLLDGLVQLLHEAGEEKEKTDYWYDFLREYQRRLKEGKTAAGRLYRELTEERREACRKEEEAGFLERHTAVLREKGIADWQQWIPEDTDDAEDAFAHAKTGFLDEQHRLEEKEEQGLRSIDHAFGFLEEAFGNGQEMIVFVTGLTLSPDAAAFLADNVCEKYQQYYQELLVGTRKRELLDELAKE